MGKQRLLGLNQPIILLLNLPFLNNRRGYTLKMPLYLVVACGNNPKGINKFSPIF
jgi:hypothetical protein